jgi:hypothetical protein
MRLIIAATLIALALTIAWPVTSGLIVPAVVLIERHLMKE